jgi:uncharacterized protein (DUF885 family)
VLELADDLHALTLDADPLAASFFGEPGYEDRLPDLSRAAAARLVTALRAVLDRADALTPANAAEDVTLAAIRHTALGGITWAEVALVECSPGPYGDGPAALVMAASRTAPESDQAAAAHLDRARAYAAYLDQCGDRLRDGAAAGRTPAAVVLEVSIDQCDGWLEGETLGPLGSVEMPDPEQSLELAQIVARSTRPALERYRATLASLRPMARPDDRAGLSALPGGAADYDRLVALHTTLPLTAAEVHEIGLAACDELGARMTELGATLGLDGLPALVARLRELASQADPASAMEAARTAVRRAEALAPQYFSPPLPAPCRVEPMEAGMGRAGMAPHYAPPTVDGLVEGTYWFNAEIPGIGGGWDLESVAYHEAVPGHHLQIARDQLRPDLPKLQRQANVTAMSEGWGLYAEVLAGEMGLYSSDEQRLGALGVQAMRAARLVVDTGIHALGWDRERAVAFLRERVPVGEPFLVAEVTRYISIPGQALAYMTGQRELLRLRGQAQTRLGDRFDLRGFHDAVLGNGQVPLPAVAAAVDRWVGSAGG